MVLDLDNQATWKKEFELCYNTPSSEENDAQEDFLHILKNNYSYVVGYHACRTDNPMSYRENGVRPSSSDITLKRARYLFDGISGLDDVLSKINRKTLCLERYNGCVGVLLSRKWAIREHSDYFKGSEGLRRIAAQLNSEDAFSRIENSGRATLISFKIPIEWLSEMVDEKCSIYSRSLYKLFTNESYLLEGGYLLRKAIPSKYIFEVKDVQDEMPNKGMEPTSANAQSVVPEG